MSLADEMDDRSFAEVNEQLDKFRELQEIPDSGCRSCVYWRKHLAVVEAAYSSALRMMYDTVAQISATTGDMAIQKKWLDLRVSFESSRHFSDVYAEQVLKDIEAGTLSKEGEGDDEAD